MSINYTNLVAQGRAKALGKPWEPEEWEAVNLLVTKRQITREQAADYVRNGIMTLEDFDLAQKAEFKPKTLEETAVIAEELLKEEARAALSGTTEKQTKKDKPAKKGESK